MPRKLRTASLLSGIPYSLTTLILSGDGFSPSLVKINLFSPELTFLLECCTVIFCFKIVRNVLFRLVLEEECHVAGGYSGEGHQIMAASNTSCDYLALKINLLGQFFHGVLNVAICLVLGCRRKEGVSGLRKWRARSF